MATVYLLHFNKKVAGHAGHYLGFTNRKLEQRLRDHRSKTDGASLTRALIQNGGDFRVAATMKFDCPYKARAMERFLKNRKNHSQLCPICKAIKKGQPAMVNKKRFTNDVVCALILP